MIFNSYIFVLAFLPTSLIIFYGAKLISPFSAKLAISLLSIFFYGFWDIYNVPLLLFSIFFNYLLGFAIDGCSQRKRLLLFFGIAVNLLILSYYKYSSFFLGVVGFKSTFSSLILPLAISFFTFEQVSYLVDRYRGHIKDNNFLNYLFFITFFPRLIAGPIYYYREYRDKIEDASKSSIDWEKLAIGMTLFSFALFKKVIIADRLAIYSDMIYSAGVEKLSTIDAWVGSLAYTLQIYFDFSAYSEMALALGLMFGLQLPINFNSPYKATSIIDFWGRWHMSLSRFIRDYIYIPLGGNRLGKLRQYQNLIITMTIAGFWHGSGWNFILWGLLYGVLLVINHILRRYNFTFPVFGGWLATFLLVHFLWVPFRADSFYQAYSIWIRMISVPEDFGTTYTLSQISFCTLALSLCLFMPNLIQIIYERNKTLRWTPKLLWSLATALVFITSILEMNHVSPFLYFNF